MYLHYEMGPRQFEEHGSSKKPSRTVFLFQAVVCKAIR